MRRLILLSVLAMTLVADALADGGRRTYYLSPTGRDRHDGQSMEKPMRSFERAFSRMRSGDALVLLDGVYSAAAGTGTIHWNDGAASAQIPSGTASATTEVRALNPGSVTIQGPLFVGRKSRKDSHIRIQGITFEGGASLYNTSFITITDSGFHGPFGIGTNDHEEGNSDNLIEDVWIWSGGSRIVAINYRGNRNVWRRVVIRGDGCGTAECSGSGNPNVGFTVYDSADVSVQNVLVVDRILMGSDSPYADFACAQHTPDPRYHFGRNEWLGVMSLNAPDIGFYCEPDSGGTVAPVLAIRDSVFWNARFGGLNLARSGAQHTLDRIWIRSGGDGFRFAPELARSGARISRLSVSGAGRYAINSSIGATDSVVSGRWEAAMNQLGCVSRCTVDPNPASSSAVAPPGKNLVRYGTDGTRFGEPGYNAPSEHSVWPWPNEERMKREMCAETKRGFCADGTVVSAYLAGTSGIADKVVDVAP
jgi:hypothetical protein